MIDRSTIKILTQIETFMEVDFSAFTTLKPFIILLLLYHHNHVLP